jgi:hypothetical protein
MRSLRSAAILITTVILSAVAGLPATARPAVDSDGDRWSYTVSPYLWLPNINGTLAFEMPPGQGGSAESSTGPNDYLENLRAVLMVSGEARKGPWTVIADLIYLSFSDEDSSLKSVDGSGGGITIPRSLNLDTETSLEGLVLMLAAGRTVSRTDAVSVDVFGGLRYFGVKTELDWDLAATIGGPGFTVQSSGKTSGDTDLVDAIVGVRGRIACAGGRWVVPYYLDIGTGSSSLTWQAVAGIGRVYRWVDLQLIYRHLFYDESSGKLLQEIRFSGPVLGATFHF